MFDDFCNDMHGVKLRELDTGPDDDITEGMRCYGDMVILKLSLQKSFYLQNIKLRRLEYRLKHTFLRRETRYKCIKALRLFFLLVRSPPVVTGTQALYYMER